MGSRVVHRACTGNAEERASGFPLPATGFRLSIGGDMRIVASIVSGLLLASISLFAQTNVKTIALRCGGLFDGRGESLRRNAFLVIEGEKIKDVSSSPPEIGRAHV